MPRYQYRCTACEEVSIIHHPASDTECCCPKCDSGSTLVKLLTRFSTSKKAVVKKKTGTATEEFIEDSRKELVQEKDRLTKER